jgi:hypothetical protein
VSALGGALVVVAVLAAGCAAVTSEPWVLDSKDMSTGPVRRAAWISSYPQALATALDALQRDVGLPPLQVRVVFLPDEHTFERLLLEIGYSPDLAASAAANMRAIGGFRHILVNEARLARLGWADRTGVFAHELAHVLQYELGGGVRGTSEQWIREGFAEWVELEVLESIAAIPAAAEARRSALRELRSMEPGQLPPLPALATFPQWVAAAQGQAAARVYDLGLTAVDALIDRHGIDAVETYFASFAARQDRRANFEAAFGQSVEAFDCEFQCEVLSCCGGCHHC